MLTIYAMYVANSAQLLSQRRFEVPHSIQTTPTRQLSLNCWSYWLVPASRRSSIGAGSPGLSQDTVARVLELFPHVAKLSLRLMCLETLQMFTDALTRQHPPVLRKLAINDVVSADVSGVGELLACLEDTTTGPGSTLELLRFNQRSWHGDGTFASDASMVSALEAVLVKNRILRAVHVVARADIPEEIKDKLMERSFDAVRPPLAIRNRDKQQRWRSSAWFGALTTREPNAASRPE